MALEIEKLLDETGWNIIRELQQDAGISYSELGKRVGLSSPSVTERIRKMEEAGIITGYHAEVSLTQLGLPVMAIIYLNSIGGRSCSHTFTEVTKIPEVLECFRLTGSDSVIVKAVATSLDHLAMIIDQLSLHGIPSTSIVRSGSMQRHTISRTIFEQNEHTGES